MEYLATEARANTFVRDEALDTLLHMSTMTLPVLRCLDGLPSAARIDVNARNQVRSARARR